MKNNVKLASKSRTYVKGIHFTFPCLPAIELFANSGADFLYLDGEHGCFDLSDIQSACIAAERAGLTVLARIPEATSPTVTRYLDRGVLGIVAPHVETVEQAKELIDAAYFAPLGRRSFGGERWFPGFQTGDRKTYLQQANERVSLCIMIESLAALNCAEHIARLDGVDYLSFGVNDLAQDLGYGDQPNHPKVLEAIAQCSEKIRAAGKPVREDFMKFAWISDVLTSGYSRLID